MSESHMSQCFIMDQVSEQIGTIHSPGMARLALSREGLAATMPPRCYFCRHPLTFEEQHRYHTGGYRVGLTKCDNCIAEDDYLAVQEGRTLPAFVDGVALM